ncbi:MAG: hypothetical protein FWC93_04660 [Defluviitaleaceae bacterium]|nr:hypothetical protein [Defluviitaleaceae bacterium]
MMKAGIPFVAESNFTPTSAEVLLPLAEKHSYRALTVLFDADIEVLHRRFCQRDVTDERHPGLATKSGDFLDFCAFSDVALPCRDFCIGDKIVVDITGFALVDYTQVDTRILDFVGGKV